MPTLLSAHEAASITRQLLEFEAINRKAELVHNLADMGVTSEKFHQWVQLANAKSLGVSQPLTVDVTNMISHLERGIKTREDAVVKMTEREIARYERDAYTRQCLVTGESP